MVVNQSTFIYEILNHIQRRFKSVLHNQELSAQANVGVDERKWKPEHHFHVLVSSQQRKLMFPSTFSSSFFHFDRNAFEWCKSEAGRGKRSIHIYFLLMFCKALQVKTLSIMVCSNMQLLICVFMQQVWICLLGIMEFVCLSKQRSSNCEFAPGRSSSCLLWMAVFTVCKCDRKVWHLCPPPVSTSEFVARMKLAWPEAIAQKKKQNMISK